ncbi:hypothetical protein QUF90_12440 [Desulfococcaceae bacterium HSG9]|nr:hypothetical protein [Desulfococcaceae bacterium HSG9]
MGILSTEQIADATGLKRAELLNYRFRWHLLQLQGFYLKRIFTGAFNPF